MKKKSTLRLCPDNDALDNYWEQTNYLSYIQLHHEVYNNPYPLNKAGCLKMDVAAQLEAEYLLFQTT